MTFAPGDLVVCVDAGVIDCANARHTGAWSPKKGSVGRVINVQHAIDFDRAPTLCDCMAVNLTDGTYGVVQRFRKIDPLADLDTRAAGKTFKLPAKPVIDPARHSREITV